MFVPVIIIWAVLSLITWIALGIFSLSYLDNYVAGAPDWMNQYNVLGWLVFAVVYLVVVLVIKHLVKIVQGILVILIMLPFGKDSTAGVITALIGVILSGLTAAAFGTYGLFQFTSQYPDITSFFLTSNWAAVGMVFLFLTGIALPGFHEFSEE